MTDSKSSTVTDSKSSTSSSTSNIDGSWESFALKLIKQAHAEVDEIRAKAGLEPWDWKKTPKTHENQEKIRAALMTRELRGIHVREGQQRSQKYQAHLERLRIIAQERARRKENRSGKKESRARAAVSGSD